MSNCVIVELETLEIRSHQVTDILRCLLHTITFNRALGAVKPRDVDSELFDLTWVTTGDPDVEARVESEVTAVQAFVDKNPGRNFQLNLNFFERKKSSQVLFFKKTEQRLVWEQWIIPFSVQVSSSEESEASRASQKHTLQQQIEACLVHIITAVNENRDHIPPVVSGNALTFPFEVTIDTSGNSSVFITDIVKRMLSSTHPPSVLH
jgi:autophagy-related protein 101